MEWNIAGFFFVAAFGQLENQLHLHHFHAVHLHALIQVRRRRDQNVLRVIWRYEETKRPSCAATVLLAFMRNAQVY